jgi:hypothetical protein
VREDPNMGDLIIPASIHAYVADRITRRWAGPERDPAPVIEGLPATLPEGQVTRLVGGGPFGWMLHARLDREADGRLVLEVLEDDRMSGPDHYRVWDDGTREELETERTTVVFPKDCSAEEAERIEQDFYAHNRRVQALLDERGFS